MKTLLPMLLVVLLLVGAIFYSLTKNLAVPKKLADKFGVPATELEIVPVTPTPSPTATPTPTPTLSLVKGRSGEAERDLTPTPSVIPTLTTKKTISSTKGSQTISTIDNPRSTQPGTPCTPVYGMANTCTEHVVVDTAGEDSIFFGFAGLSYIAGLAAFVKSKYA